MTRAGWEPTTEAEVALYEALLAGDQERYFRVLGRAHLLLPVSADAVAGRSPMGWATWTSNDHTHLLAFTSPASMRTCLAEHAGAARRMPFAELASVWPNHDWWLAVNPGLPIEGYLPAWFVIQLSQGDARLPGKTSSAPRDRLARVEALERAKAARAAGYQQPPRDNREPVRVSATVGPRALPASPPSPPTEPYPPLAPAQQPWHDPTPWHTPAPAWNDQPSRRGGPAPWREPANGPWNDPAAPPPYPAAPPPRAHPAPAYPGATYPAGEPTPDYPTAPPAAYPAAAYPGAAPAAAYPGAVPPAGYPAAPPPAYPGSGPPAAYSGAGPPASYSNGPSPAAYPAAAPEPEIYRAGWPSRGGPPPAAFTVTGEPVPAAYPPPAHGGYQGASPYPGAQSYGAARPASGDPGRRNAAAEPVAASRATDLPRRQPAVPTRPGQEGGQRSDSDADVQAAQSAAAFWRDPSIADAAKVAAGGRSTLGERLAASTGAAMSEKSVLAGERSAAAAAAVSGRSAALSARTETSQPAASFASEAPSESSGGARTSAGGLFEPTARAPRGGESAANAAGASGWPQASGGSGNARSSADAAAETGAAWSSAGVTPEPGAVWSSASAAAETGSAWPAADVPAANGDSGGARTSAGVSAEASGSSGGAWPAADVAGASGGSGGAWSSADVAGASGGSGGAWPAAGVAAEVAASGAGAGSSGGLFEGADGEGSAGWGKAGSAGAGSEGAERVEAAASVAGASGQAGNGDSKGLNGKARHAGTDPAFVPANSVEEELFEAAEAGNTDAFLSTLLLATVLIPKSAGTTNGAWRPQPIDGEPHIVCYTSSQHLAEPLETVSIKFIKLIQEWPDPTWSFAVNPGTPVGATLPGGQLLALANWAAEVGLGRDEEEQAQAPSDSKASSPVAGRANPELTVLQKAIAPSQVSYYLERGYDRVSGFVHRAHEVGHLKGIEQMRGALGLDWQGSPFAPDSTEIYLLRWSAYRPNLYRIPYGGNHEAGMKAMQGWVIERAPFRGNGFAPGESKEIIAEFKVDSARLPHGARLMRMRKDGTEEMIAVLDSDGQRWLRTDGG